MKGIEERIINGLFYPGIIILLSLSRLGHFKTSNPVPSRLSQHIYTPSPMIYPLALGCVKV